MVFWTQGSGESRSEGRLGLTYMHIYTTTCVGNGNPLQYSCLENPMDGGAWWATVHGVTKSRTRLSNFTYLLIHIHYHVCRCIYTLICVYVFTRACVKQRVSRKLSILKSRDITLPTKVRLVKAMVFPVVMYGCESWTIKNAERQRIDAFELWCWRRLLRVPWTAWRSNQSILREISPECSLERLMLKLKLQSFGHLM